ncbi:MAG: hypothetical protein ACR2QF_17585 [Geminicoccaceae bacterium]
MADLFAKRPPALPGASSTPQDEPGQLGLVESFGQGAAQGLTLGFADELYGLGAGLIPGGQNREEATKAARARLARADPRAALAGELAGSLVIPGGAARTGASLLARAGRGALAGAGQGAVGGFGRAEGGVEERLPAAGVGGALGAGLGGAGAAVAPAIAQGAQRLAGSAPVTAVQKLLGTLERGDDVGAAGQRAVLGIQEAAQRGRQGVNQAYDKVAQLEGKIEDTAAFDMLSGKFNRFIEENGIEFIEGGDRITRLADGVVERLQGQATPKNMERARQLIGSIQRNVSPDKPQERMFLGALQREYDDWMFDTLKNKLYRGDEQALNQIKEARGLSREFNRLFGEGGRAGTDRRAGKIISEIMRDGVEAEEAVNLLFGGHGLGVKGSRQALARIRDISPDAFGEMRGAHFMKLVTGDGKGDFLTGAQIGKRIQQATVNQGPMMRILYGEDRGQLSKFGQQLATAPNVAQKVAEFVRARPVIMGFLLGGSGFAAGQDPTTAALGGTFTGLLLAGLNRGGGAGAIQAAARGPGPAAAGQVGASIGGTLGALGGPSLQGR